MSISKHYQPQKIENKIYKLWEKSGFLKTKISKNKKPFCIIMPPVNANGPLHIGHAVFVTLEDIMIRYQRMRQKNVLWLPGVDHAGFETQVVFEKELEKQGKTRFQIPPKKLYQMIFGFTQKNRKIVREQFKKLGASCDWSREKFTLEEGIIKIVYKTFKKLYKDGLVYRGKRIINWCPRHQTALSDLEIKHEIKKGKLWHIKYYLKSQKTNFQKQEKGSKNYIIVATTRPETMLGDTGIAVNPKDKRYKKFVGKTAILPLINREIPIVASNKVDVNFGTGAVKVTPACDVIDFEIAKEHHLKIIEIVGKDGKMKNVPPSYQGLTTLACREKIVKELQEKGYLEKAENYTHQISVCYKCKTPIEPLISEQWFVKIKPLAKAAMEAVEKGKIKFIPEYYKKIYFHWMKNIKDWNISRQIVWGIRIPIWYGIKNGKIKKIIVSEKKPKLPKGSDYLKKETDTFDTWFSSGQWPFAALGFPKNKDYKYFYPTSVMETGWDILFFWVARMIMLSLYVTGEVPFRYVFLHGLVRDKDRQKMSKSKGNVIDPLGVVNLYGADALRAALVFGTGAGKDIIISEEKIIGQKRFANKIWNASRFIFQQISSSKLKTQNIKLQFKIQNLTEADKKILNGLNEIIGSVTKDLDDFQFHNALQKIYQFFWHRFCDLYIEKSKKQLQEKALQEETLKILLYVLLQSIKLLHPFMPFLTEEIYQKLPIKNKQKCLMVESWPSQKPKI